MVTQPALPVGPANALTARWIRAIGNHPTVSSGAAVWPLLAIIAGAAGGAARDELAAAAGIDPAVGTQAGRALIEGIAGADGVSAALGLWSRPEVPIRPEWLAELPTGVHEQFTGDLGADQATLDAWARDRTDGMIKRMPVRIDASTLVLLASALTVRTTWREPFGKTRTPGHWPLMTRTTSAPSIVRATATVACVRIEGNNGIDVELVIGPVGVPASETLSAGLAVVTGAVEAGSGDDLLDGAPAPGIVVDHIVSTTNAPQCVVEAPKFTVRASHDLTAFPDVFGLDTVLDAGEQRLPGISERPIAVGKAAQDAIAEFTDTGFRAAAVTATTMRPTSMTRRLQEYEVRRVTATFDRPYGFLAVHRSTGLVLVSGWVTAPDAD
jgi:serine protease inhibitor